MKRQLLIAGLIILLGLAGELTGRLLETVSMYENSPLGSVLLDMDAALVRQGYPAPGENASIYAAQQEAFWPFTVSNYQIMLARPLDREAICQRQHLSETRPHLLASDISASAAASSLFRVATGNQARESEAELGQPEESRCPPGACCQLLHVNVEHRQTELPRAYFIRVAVLDENDNAPRFPSVDNPFALVPEDVPIGWRLDLPVAFDPDSRQFSIAQYRVDSWTQGNASHFRLVIADAQPDINTGLTKSEYP
ncbi:unnamed protein product [Protopolystoma xenopodis]|uniref:Cadherin domain-containing protein n=1 Tax=Protopolystoma xenopodis TaxID=117903 RepID=A0A3S5BP42_9PLAT|nr:unnamed protein product [Protopolystoma xenopodis]